MTDAAVCTVQTNCDTPSREHHALVEAPTTYAVLWNGDAATEALNERRVELGLSMRELDDAAEQAPGTAAKYLGPGQVKSLGVYSLFKIARALGLRVTLEIDPKATAALLAQSRQRHENQVRERNFAQKCSQRIVERALRHLAVEYSWPEILAVVGESRRTVAAEQAKAARKAAKCD